MYIYYVSSIYMITMSKSKRKKMVLITTHLPKSYIEGLERLVESGRYPNKSEAIRVAVRELLVKEQYFIQREKEIEEELRNRFLGG